MEEEKKGVLGRWRAGVQRVTPLQQARARRAGVIGQLFGIALVSVGVILQASYWWIPLLLFTSFIMVVQLITEEQTVVQLERFAGLRP